MIIRGDDLALTPQEGRPLQLARVINIDEHTERISLTYVNIWGHHERVVNEISDRVYYIIEGQGRFQMGDDALVEVVNGGDFVYIPQGVPYEFEGTMRYIVVNGPAYRTASDRVLPPVLATR